VLVVASKNAIGNPPHLPPPPLYEPTLYAGWPEGSGRDSTTGCRPTDQSHFVIWCHHTGAGGGVLGEKQGGKMNSAMQLVALPKGVK